MRLHQVLDYNLGLSVSIGPVEPEVEGNLLVLAVSFVGVVINARRVHETYQLTSGWKGVFRLSRSARRGESLLGRSGRRLVTTCARLMAIEHEARLICSPILVRGTVEGCAEETGRGDTLVGETLEVGSLDCGFGASRCPDVDEARCLRGNNHPHIRCFFDCSPS